MLLFDFSSNKNAMLSQESAKLLSIIHLSSNPNYHQAVSSMLSQASVHPMQKHRAIALHQAETLKEVRDLAENNKIHILLLSLDAGVTLLDQLYTIRATTNNLPVVIISELHQSAAIQEALHAGVQDVLVGGEFSAIGLARALQYAYERSQSVAKMERLRDKARKNNAIKNELIYKIAQEVRKGIDRVIDITEQEGALLHNSESIGKLREQTLELSTVMSAALDYTEINSGKAKVNPIKFSAEHYLRELLTLLANRANNRGHVSLTHFSLPCPRLAVADVDKIWRITVTAFEATLKIAKPQRAILLSAKISNEINSSNLLKISIRLCQTDIAEKDITTLFESLNQKDLAVVHKHGTTGLNLSVAAALAEIISGKLWFEFQPKNGLVFHLETALGTH